MDHLNPIIMKKIILLFAVILLITSCLPIKHDVVIDTNSSLCGFWTGLWHGIISPITFVVSLFSDSVVVWDINNNGGWYTFGFLLGIGGLSGGGSKASSK